jgi:signal transduction histidine kinase
VDYLTKPIHPAILKSKVAVFVDLFRKSRALAAANDVLELEILQRRKAAAELKDINSQLEAFVYSIAHDLRTPLRAVEALSKILLDEYGDKLDETGRDFASRINQSAEFMDKLLLDLLEYGRAVRAEMELGSVAVKTAWEAAVFQCQHQIREREALVEVASPLPLVRANEATLGQVLTNLLNNALRFAREGVQPHIRLRAEQGEKAVRLWVEDNGIGIKAEHLDRIFRVFEQLHGSNYGGTGIGLAIVRKGVERMEGSVGVESAPGQGSRFWIELQSAGQHSLGSHAGEESPRPATKSVADRS